MSEKPTDIYQLVASSKAPLPSEPAPVVTQSTSTNSLKESTSTNSLPPKKEDSTSEAEGTEEGSTVYVPPPRPAFRSDANDDILQKCLGMTDLIFAIYAVEVWHYDEETGKIFNVNLPSDDEESGGGGGGGLLLKRNPQETDVDNDYYTKEAEEAFYQLTDPSRSNFLPAGSADPGVGLAGALWAESSNVAGGVHYRAWGEMSHLQGNISLSWRDVCELAEDPDQVCLFIAL